MEKKLDPAFREFVLWLCDPRCPFTPHYNGTEPDQERVTFDKGNKNYTIDGVWKYWSEKQKDNC
jgi:hypothetical protein